MKYRSFLTNINERDDSGGLGNAPVRDLTRGDKRNAMFKVSLDGWQKTGRVPFNPRRGNTGDDDVV